MHVGPEQEQRMTTEHGGIQGNGAGGDAAAAAGDLRARFGLAQHRERPVEHARPSDADDRTVAAAGKLSAAFEIVENARGHLYEFHRMSGAADLALQEAVEAIREAGHTKLADEIDDVLVGRDVVRDMWTFQIVEAYDRQYYRVFQAVDVKVTDELCGGEPHVFESEMKAHEQGADDDAAGGSGAGDHPPR